MHVCVGVGVSVEKIKAWQTGLKLKVNDESLIDAGLDVGTLSLSRSVVCKWAEESGN